MPVDIEKVRQDTPACEKIIHFNNAGASLMPQPVLNAVVEHLYLEAAQGGYEAAELAQEKVDQTYQAIATLLGASKPEIAIIENATRAWDMAFYSIPFQAGDRILTAQAEYGSNYIAFLQMAKKTGATIEVIPNDETGQVSVEALANLLDERVKLVAITHAPTNGGLVNPVAAIGQLTRQLDKCAFLVDACQSAGQLKLDVEAIGCDFLSATGRKYLRGPRGTGFLYVRQNALERLGLEPPLLDNHAASWKTLNSYEVRSDARCFENWETNYSTKIGLGVAVNYALAIGLENIEVRVKYLAGLLRKRLTDIAGVTVQDLGVEQSGIVTFTKAGADTQTLKKQLQAEQINTTVSPAFATLVDMTRRELESVNRASVHYYNSEAEIDQFCSTLAKL